jgi:hypothetical protein
MAFVGRWRPAPASTAIRTVRPRRIKASRRRDGRWWLVLSVPAVRSRRAWFFDAFDVVHRLADAQSLPRMVRIGIVHTERDLRPVSELTTRVWSLRPGNLFFPGQALQ